MRRSARGLASNVNAAPMRLVHKIQPQKSCESMEKAPTSARYALEVWFDSVLTSSFGNAYAMWVMNTDLLHSSC